METKERIEFQNKFTMNGHFEWVEREDMDDKARIEDVLRRLGLYSQIHSPLREKLIEEMAEALIKEGMTFVKAN